MAKYVLGDIHGNKTAWEAIKNKINLQADDELYILGDVIDRGEFGIEILKEIMKAPNMHMLLGNHEYMMLNAYGIEYEPGDPEVKRDEDTLTRLWYQNGGYVTNKDLLRMTPIEHNEILSYVKSLPLNIYLKVGDISYALCHAQIESLYDIAIDAGVTGYSSKAHFCVWDRDFMFVVGRTVSNDMRVIYGHTPTINLINNENELPNNPDYMSVFKYKNMYVIDCGAAYGDKYGKPAGRLACMRLDDQKIFYSEGD